ncbi:hypothetical protein E3U55_04485 [Filobacillus milosensis]|uniref:Lipoprotein n=1 Tax=Filobacillus milosensis TaxID=94137 RepID=A0A4Y8IXH2_9BACI|nr:hypothetical protein [Filobacillus milosensis]TFB24075.1 hypothetical protein E3U55_04485 [Filobacillus milosensis]
MKKIVLIATLIGTLLLSGCNNKTVTNDKHYQQTIEQLQQENQKLKDKNTSLQKETENNEEEKQAFINANYFSYAFISAMIRGDAEELNKMSTSNTEFFSDYFKQHLKDGRTGEISLSNMQTEAFKEHNIIIQVHGYAYTPSKNTINIRYGIYPKNSSVFWVNISLKQDGKQWIVDGLNFGA